MDQSETDAQESPWQKLRQRKVVHWSLAYVAVAWAMVQVLDFAVATFAWPSVLTRAGAVLALFGLPVAITLAWFHGERGEQRFTRAELALLALLVLGGGVAARQVIVAPAPVPASAAAIPAPAETSVTAFDRHRLAILPFANFGDDPANAAFVSGVHDTLLTQVAKVPGLSVISRSSVLQFAGRQPTIGEVAAALRVGAVIEGSVARSGQRLRIQVQLIDAARDEHLWAETYDRDADDLFAVQSEIAQTIAEQLRIRLSNRETERLHALATRNPRAYEYYVLGRSHVPPRRWREAISELTRAVTLDPEFALAHAELSMAHTWLGFEERGEWPTSIPLARSAAERALALDPTLPAAHLALAIFLYRGEPDIERAAAEFERAIAGMPNDAAAHLNFGFLRRWQGRWEESAALFLRAAELDPRGDGPEASFLALAGQGRRAEAEALIATAQAANPDHVRLFMLPGELATQRDCDLATYERVLQQTGQRFAGHPDVLHERWFFAWQLGDARAALAFAEQLAQIPNADPERIHWRLAVARMLSGEKAEAERQMHKVIELLEAVLAPAPTGELRAYVLSHLALRHSLVQEHAPAVEQAHRSLAELPPAGAMIQRTEILLFVAVALARAGALEEALPLIRQSLAVPQPRTARGLWCDPLLASLRGDAAVRELMAELGADLSIDPARRETWPKPHRGG